MDFQFTKMFVKIIETKNELKYNTSSKTHLEWASLIVLFVQIIYDLYIYNIQVIHANYKFNILAKTNIAISFAVLLYSCFMNLVIS